MTSVQHHVDSHSERRYQFFASWFHFLRWRSSPSTFRAVGVPRSRGIHVNTALAALQYSTTSKRFFNAANVESHVCVTVSRYLCRMVGTYSRRTPRYMGSGYWERQYTVT